MQHCKEFEYGSGVYYTSNQENHIGTTLNLYAYVYIYIYMYTCIYSLCVYIYIYINANVSVYVYAYVCIYIYTHAPIYIYLSDGVTVHCLNYHASFIRRSKLQIVGLAIKPYRDMKFCFRA